MEKRVSEIAKFLDGTVSGDGNIVISGVKGIDEAEKGDLTFLANPKYRKKLEDTRASAVLVSQAVPSAAALIIVSDPYLCLAKILGLFYPPEPVVPGVSKSAYICSGASVSADAMVYPGAYVGKNAVIGSRTVLHPGVYIGDETTIGQDTVIFPNVTIYRRCKIGSRVIIHAGVVIGSDGFGFANPGRENFKVPQIGIVQIDDDVEIGANTTIDRATLGKTWIGRRVKIDNLVQVAHNVTIGENSIIVSQVGISGSTKLGKSVVIGGQAGLIGHITIGDGVMIGAQSGISDDVVAGQTVSGSPHLPHRKWLRTQVIVSRLPEIYKKISELEKKISELENK